MAACRRCDAPTPYRAAHPERRRCGRRGRHRHATAACRRRCRTSAGWRRAARFHARRSCRSGRCVRHDAPRSCHRPGRSFAARRRSAPASSRSPHRWRCRRPSASRRPPPRRADRRRSPCRVLPAWVPSRLAPWVRPGSSPVPQGRAAAVIGRRASGQVWSSRRNLTPRRVRASRYAPTASVTLAKPSRARHASRSVRMRRARPGPSKTSAE